MTDQIPEYLNDQTYEGILQRMLDRIPDDIDKTEGSYIWDALSPAAYELLVAVIWVQETLRKGFASTVASDVPGEVTDWLDLRVKEHGLTRKPAEYASGKVTFSGVAGTLIPIGTRIATPAGSRDNETAVLFETLNDVNIDTNGSIDANIQAIEAGTSGNVAANAIQIMVDTITGVTSVTNASATSGGIDIEDDIALLQRYLQHVRSPSAGGNKADYIRWATEVSGVGGASVVPIEDGPGTVNIYIIDSNKAPAVQDLIEDVQNYIAPPYDHVEEESQYTISNSNGVSLISLSDAVNGQAYEMDYNATGQGEIVRSDLQTILEKGGLWWFKPSVKVDTNTASSDLVQFGIWNVSSNSWAKTQNGGAVDAVLTQKASDLGTSFGQSAIQFYWNGADYLEIRITRLQTDTTTKLYFDNHELISAFSQDTGEEKAPVGASVSVRSAIAVQVNVSATMTIADGYDAASVKSSVQTALDGYIKSLAFQDDNDVKFAKIGSTILETNGVQDYSNLLLNSGTGNVVIQNKEVAVLGTVSFT
jgi:uncharacterized phage protein gp47/JayE